MMCAAYVKDVQKTHCWHQVVIMCRPPPVPAQVSDTDSESQVCARSSVNSGNKCAATQ